MKRKTITIPTTPPDDLIESMCVRFDHCHGHTAFGESEAAWRRRQAHNRRVMRQLYEEVSGEGFYRWPDRAASCGGACETVLDIDPNGSSFGSDP